MALPSGYTKLLCIQATGTQYINTGHTIASENMRVVMEFCYTGTHSDSTLFGSETAGITGSGEYSICPYGTPQFFVGGSKALTAAYAPALEEVCTLDVRAKNGTLTEVWNESTTKTQSYVQSLNHTYSIYLFANNISGTAKQLCPMKLYSWQMYDNDVLVRDFVPAMRNSDGAVGLYDLVNAVFYTNAGSGTFSYELPPIGASRMLLVEGTGYDILGGKGIVDGTAYNILEGKTLVDGTVYTIPFKKKGTPTGDLPVGSSVFLNVNGVLREFIIVNQGIPSNSSIYDASCDGTWLLMKDIYMSQAWCSDTGPNSYSLSNHHSYLNNTFFPLLDAEVQDVVKNAKIPYCSGMPGANQFTINSGGNGLTAKCFLLSAYEVFSDPTIGVSNYTSQDGALLSYFKNTSASIRIATLNGTATAWAERSMGHAQSKGSITNRYAHTVSTSGGSTGDWANLSTGIRPALILPNDALFDEDTMEFVGVG